MCILNSSYIVLTLHILRFQVSWPQGFSNWKKSRVAVVRLVSRSIPVNEWVRSSVGFGYGSRCRSRFGYGESNRNIGGIRLVSRSIRVNDGSNSHLVAV